MMLLLTAMPVLTGHMALAVHVFLTNCLCQALGAVLAELLVMALHHVQTNAAHSCLTLQTTKEAAQQAVLEQGSTIDPLDTEGLYQDELAVDYEQEAPQQHSLSIALELMLGHMKSHRRVLISLIQWCSSSSGTGELQKDRMHSFISSPCTALGVPCGAPTLSNSCRPLAGQHAHRQFCKHRASRTK